MHGWEKQVLGHVNNVVDILREGNVHENLLVINIDLERKNIIVREDGGEGPFMTFFNASDVVIRDKSNRRPGKKEFVSRL